MRLSEKKKSNDQSFFHELSFILFKSILVWVCLSICLSVCLSLSLSLFLSLSLSLSLFEYGSICTTTAAECHLEKLQLLQNQALRSILKTPNYVAVKDLHDLSAIPRIKEHLLAFAQKQLGTMKTHSPIIQSTIDNYRKVAHVKENASILDILS